MTPLPYFLIAIRAIQKYSINARVTNSLYILSIIWSILCKDRYKKISNYLWRDKNDVLFYSEDKFSFTKRRVLATLKRMLARSMFFTVQSYRNSVNRGCRSLTEFFCRIGSLRLPENIYYYSYLCRCISSAAGLHAGVQQVLLQSGSGVYPFVELVDGSLLCHVVDVVQCQLSFPVTVYREGSI